MPQQSDLLAVLVDADNISPARIGGVLAEIAGYGTASVKRVYGDWTKSQLRGWKDAASAHVIQPMQQFDNTTGKNATDSALIIDAMDLLYAGRFQGFCIVSSDSDFTRLASRIREEGVTVYGFGERKTPEAFRNACDQFTYLDVLEVPAAEDAAAPASTVTRFTPSKLKKDARLVSLLRASIETASDEDGWSDLGTVGQLMRKQHPDFDPRNWGYAKLSDLVKALGLFTIESKPGGMSLRPIAGDEPKDAVEPAASETPAATAVAAKKGAGRTRAPRAPRTGDGGTAAPEPSTDPAPEAESEATAAPDPAPAAKAPRKRRASTRSATSSTESTPAGSAPTDSTATDSAPSDTPAVAAAATDASGSDASAPVEPAPPAPRTRAPRRASRPGSATT